MKLSTAVRNARRITKGAYDVSLDEIQPIFGREVAGNHSVLAMFDDGSVLCSAYTNDGRRFFFIGHDESLSDWDLISVDDTFTALLSFHSTGV